MQKVRDNWLLLTLFFLIGSILGGAGLILFKKFSFFTIQNNIGLSLNPVEVVSIAINIILAIYITAKLSRKNDLERSEKQFLINSFEAFSRDTNKIIATYISNEDFDTINVKAKFKSLRIKLQSLIKLGQDYDLLDTKESNDSIAHKLTELWELFTDSPRKASKSSPKSVQEDFEYLRVQRISDIERKQIEFEEEIFKIIFRINRK